MKDLFCKIFTENIKREGAEKLLDWLKTTDFFTAPASTRYHNSFECGLVMHSLNVYDMLSKSEVKMSAETRAILALLHDICKADFYVRGTRNVKNEETGAWEKVLCYTVDDTCPYGHGEKSAYIISSFMKLTRAEAMAINWHMGGFDDRVKGGSYAMKGAFTKYPLALELHIADMRATYMLDSENENEVKGFWKNTDTSQQTGEPSTT